MSDSVPSPEHIQALFAAAEARMTFERAQHLAAEIAAHGGLDNAIAMLAHDQAFAVLQDALAYRALLSEAHDPSAAIDRLLRQARDLDARAEPAWAEAANLCGRAAWRLAQGETDLAGRMRAQAGAAERFAADLEERAFRLRQDAARRRAAAAMHARLVDVAA
jgi:hypothetical protein